MKIWTDIKDIASATFKAFFEDRIFKLSAALAYYTVLAISPILMIIISVASIIYKKDAIENQVYAELNELIGSDLAHEIQRFVLNSSLTGKSDIALISGLVVLFVASTAVFAEIQDSLNFIWQVKAKPKHGWLKIIKDRILSFSIIVSLAFILLVSMLINTILRSFGNYIERLLPHYDATNEVVFYLANKGIGFIVSAFIFALIFKILPDVKLKWKPAIAGAIFTTILFIIGQYIISYYLMQFKPGLNFGSAGSVIALLVWVYYTSVILYLGAEFTQVYAEKYYNGIPPNDNAVYLKVTEEEKNVAILPAQHPEQTQND
ncbi:MAG: YihY/virulence factor BrkB family protein [Flavobacteriaceae bacterium]|nr:YihY/virulence factor BrkB family protein [Flavobacteriaceae bacterium]